MKWKDKISGADRPTTASKPLPEPSTSTLATHSQYPTTTSFETRSALAHMGARVPSLAPNCTAPRSMSHAPKLLTRMTLDRGD